jgi:polyhydroxyalkanoate synthesis regulator phasin
MNKLSKKQLEQRDHFDSRIHDHFDELEAAISTFNEKVAALHAELIVPEVEKLNVTLGEAKEFVDELHSDAENYYNERSEKWQEGDKGQEYNTWFENMSNVGESIEEVEVPEPTEITLDDLIDMDREVMNEITDSPEG